MKDIISGSPFLFYWVSDQIEIIKHVDDKIAYMGSDEDWLIKFGGGLRISADRNGEAWAWNGSFVHP